jgi:hypothetical protein
MIWPETLLNQRINRFCQTKKPLKIILHLLKSIHNFANVSVYCIVAELNGKVEVYDMGDELGANV